MRLRDHELAIWLGEYPRNQYTLSELFLSRENRLPPLCRGARIVERTLTVAFGAAVLAATGITPVSGVLLIAAKAAGWTGGLIAHAILPDPALRVHPLYTPRF